MSNKILRKTLPMKLQFFAEGGEADTQGQQVPDGGSTPNLDDLIAQLAQERAEKEALKNANDKNSKEAAEYKRRLREKMSAEEQITEEQRIQREAHEKEFNDMKRELAVIRAEKSYMRLEMDPETANKAAVASVSGDNETLYSILEAHIKAVKEKAKQEFLASRPDIAAGSGDTGKTDLSIEISKNLQRRKAGIDKDALKNLL